MKPVTRGEAGRFLSDVVRERLRMSMDEAVRLVKQGGVRVNDRTCVEAGLRLRTGDRLTVDRPRAAGPSAMSGTKGPVLRHVDDHLVVVDKPAGLTTVRHRHEAAEFGSRGRRYLPPTLADLLPDLLQAKTGKRKAVHAVHRLDKDTSGLVVFALSRLAVRHLGKQFRVHSIGRSYLALVRGRAEDRRVESRLVEDRGDHRRGSSADGMSGKLAVTHVEVVELLGSFSLVRCRLETGRTHQARIHLGESGWPICGETIYDRPVHGRAEPDLSGTPRLALHAAILELRHPATDELMRWESRLPDDLFKVLRRLRKQA